MKDETVTNIHENRDPITGAPGSHPIGTGIGAAAGAAAAGAAIGTVAGPVGTVVGMAAGAIVGGLAGKGVAESIDPTVEDAYWRSNYNTRPYVDKDESYELYQPAYRVGYLGYSRYSGKSYDEVEDELRSEYESSRSAEGLDWDDVQPATRDAWHRVQNRKPENL